MAKIWLVPLIKIPHDEPLQLLAHFFSDPGLQETGQVGSCLNNQKVMAQVHPSQLPSTVAHRAEWHGAVPNQRVGVIYVPWSPVVDVDWKPVVDDALCVSADSSDAQGGHLGPPRRGFQRIDKPFL